MLSIIIPTLNEEEYLPRLLDSIKKQGFGEHEIIVADAGSTDATVSIAQAHGCRVVPGGLPAKGRNNGAKAATGQLLFFLDSDTILPEGFFEKTMEEFSRRRLDIASFCLYLVPHNRLGNLILDVFYNTMVKTLEKILPHSAVGILVQRELFEKLHGYDETITLAEDHDLARRAVKYGTLGIIRSTSILVSDRRFKKDGWWVTGAKYLLCELHTIFIGPVRSDIFKYKFNHYKK